MIDDDSTTGLTAEDQRFGRALDAYLKMFGSPGIWVLRAGDTEALERAVAEGKRLPGDADRIPPGAVT